jgi:hypothetical protein
VVAILDALLRDIHLTSPVLRLKVALDHFLAKYTVDSTLRAEMGAERNREG